MTIPLPLPPDTEVVILYTPDVDVDRNRDGLPGPDHRYLELIPWSQTVSLVVALTGTAERVLVSPSGICFLPIWPDGRYAPFSRLKQVFEHAQDIEDWLRGTAENQGVPPWIPQWLAAEPGAAEHVLGQIRERVAGKREEEIILRNRHDRKVTITIPARRLLARSDVPAGDCATTRLLGRENYIVAENRAGVRVHVPVGTDTGSCPGQGQIVRVSQSSS